MSDLTPSDLHPETLRNRPGNVADAVRLQARIDAVRRWLDDVRDDVRGWIDDKADNLESLTGATFNAPVSQVGRALRTDPQPKPRVSDPHEFAAWLADAGHSDYVAEDVELVCDDPAAAADALVYVNGWLDDRSGDIEDDLYEFVQRVGDLTDNLRFARRYVPAEDALDDLLDDPDVPVTVATSGDDPQVVSFDTDTGDTVPVPGTDVTQASRRLQVRIDPDHKRLLDRQIADAVGPPTLAAHNDEEA